MITRSFTLGVHGRRIAVRVEPHLPVYVAPPRRARRDGTSTAHQPLLPPSRPSALLHLYESVRKKRSTRTSTTEAAIEPAPPPSLRLRLSGWTVMMGMAVEGRGRTWKRTKETWVAMEVEVWTKMTRILVMID